MSTVPKEYEVIAEMVEEASRVLDLGCGPGDLLAMLMREKRVTGSCVDIDEIHVGECVRKGLSVFQGDIDQGLQDYADHSYDYVILNDTLQMTHKPQYVINEMVRVGRKAIISFPNFAHLKVRIRLFFTGRMPRSRNLPFEWHERPNIHLTTFKDFKRLCQLNGIQITGQINFIGNRVISARWSGNLIASSGMFVIRKGER